MKGVCQAYARAMPAPSTSTSVPDESHTQSCRPRAVQLRRDHNTKTVLFKRKGKQCPHQTATNNGGHAAARKPVKELRLNNGNISQNDE